MKKTIIVAKASDSIASLKTSVIIVYVKIEKTNRKIMKEITVICSLLPTVLLAFDADIIPDL